MLGSTLDDLMLLDDTTSTNILENPKNLVNQVSKNGNNLEIKPAREFTHNKVLTTEERVLIGTLAKTGLDSQKNIAEEFNINQAQVSYLKNSRVNNLANPTYKEHPELRQALDNKLSEVQEKSLNLLTRALGISEDKIDAVNAKDASIIALNAARVISNVAPRSTEESKINIVMYAPRQKELKEYEVEEI